MTPLWQMVLFRVTSVAGEYQRQELSGGGAVLLFLEGCLQ